MSSNDGDETRTRVLDGVTVVDLSTFVTGGFATTMLANQARR
jgi:crotonobetainyl-CoA:carnitine CoA-transferase CaiB-like acyl-CoA transferase